MNIKQSFILALKSLAASKMRSFLTMLGIIIGVAAVIILVGLVDGMKADMVNQFESMGTNLLTVNIMGRGGNRAVDPDEMQELADKNGDVLSSVSPTVSIMGATIKFEKSNVDTTTCTGVNEYYNTISNNKITMGRDICYVDVANREKNCVIGSYLVKELFNGQSPLGANIYINGYAFKVVGVLEEKADSKESTSDDAIYIPYTVGQKVARTNIASYKFSAASKDTVDAAEDVIYAFLLKKFTSSDAFLIVNSTAIVDTLNDMIGKMTLMLVGIAGISLLVGGIGIMNIMLVSVTERTREIGIRKSLGATPWDILGQFVVEAITTSAIGGLVGILLGIAGTYFITKAFDFSFVISVTAIAIAFTVSAGIGVAFGYFPARKASKLNPIDALRYD